MPDYKPQKESQTTSQFVGSFIRSVPGNAPCLVGQKRAYWGMNIPDPTDGSAHDGPSVGAR